MLLTVIDILDGMIKGIHINKDILIVSIANVIKIICWIILAIVFDKWWIALFSLLFITSLQYKSQHCITCDKCGKRSPYAESYNEALEKAKKVGWYHTDKNKDYCPECRFTKENSYE